MKLRFIINPISGSGNNENIPDLIKKNLDHKKFQYDVVYTEKEKHAIELSQKAVEEKIDVVVAVGGDGTLNECAQSIIDSETALSVIPRGSGNGFAYHLKIDKDVINCIKKLNHSTISKIDSCSANGKPFINVSGIGFDAHIAHLFSNNNVRGFSSYIKLVLKECILYPSKEYTIRYDKQEKKVNAFLISWANSSQFGNNAVISPNSKIDDGYFEICIVKKLPRILIPVLLYRLLNNSIQKSRYVEIISCKEAQILCKDGKSHLDGEVYNFENKINLKNHSLSLKIFTPNGKEK
jgi:YegS/Rv2252/BmrU family lipid kinase